jgi:chemotaxis protein MotA
MIMAADKASVGAVLLGLSGILGGLLLEGGNLSQILQPTAALIVFGGTAGAVLIQFPLPVVLQSLRRRAGVFFEPVAKLEASLELLVSLSNIARRYGIVPLDTELDTISDPFLKRVLMLAVDGTEPQSLRKIVELELDNLCEREERLPQVFESAGGFLPTVGIIGAVLGLIQVMQQLDKIDMVGRGIAVVGAANLMFLPAAGKLRIRLREEQVQREMVLEGVISILEGMNPRMLQTSLHSFLADSGVENERVNTRTKTAGA